jgi:hypothetical protein
LLLKEAGMRDDIDLAAMAAEEEGEFDWTKGEYDDDIEYVKRVMNSERMKEVRRIKEQCSREDSMRTPEEREQHTREVIERMEKRLGRKIPVVDYSKSGRSK